MVKLNRMRTFSLAALAGAVVLLALAGVAGAATIGPDAYGYRATNEVTYAFENITSTTVLRYVDDASVTVGLGFTFNFYGTDYTQVSFSVNGLITFVNPSTAYLNYALSSSLTPRPCIAVLWDDLDTRNSASAVIYRTEGDAGSRRFIVLWKNVLHYGSTGYATFEAILFEGSNNILLQYASVAGFQGSEFDNGASATVGIGGPSRGDYLQWSYNQAIIYDGEAILYTAPVPGGLLLLGSGLAGLAVMRRRFMG